MKPSSILISVLIATTAFAASAADKSTWHNLEELIQAVARDGKTSKFPAPMAAKLGLAKQDQSARKLRYRGSVTPDHLDRAFEVLVSEANGGKPNGDGIVLTSVLATKVGDTHELDGYVFRAALSGKLIRACHNHGRSGDVYSDELPLSADVRARFQRELDFYLKDAVALGLEPVK